MEKNQLKQYHEIRNILQDELSKSRYEHSLGVEFTSSALAMKYDTNIIEKAKMAGLLHDCTKHISKKEHMILCKNNNVEITEVEERNPHLMHGKTGAIHAKNKYSITDNEILSAINYHTTGRPDMTLLEKIVFTADYIEPGRSTAPNLDRIRQIAFDDIDVAVYEILNDTISYLRSDNKEIDTTSIDTYNYYKKLVEDKYKKGDTL